MPARAALLAVIVAGALAATPAAAQARFVLGIADQSTAMLSDERFTALGVEDTRIVVPYDVALDPVQLARYAPFLDTAHAREIRVLVAFNGPAASTRLPSVRAYTRAMRAFRARFPWVRDLGTWNEANHASQPTARHPRRAAQYFNALRALCRSCRIVAADVLDQAGFATWIRTFRRTARGRADLGPAQLRRRQPRPRRLDPAPAPRDRRARLGVAHGDGRGRALRALVRL